MLFRSYFRPLANGLPAGFLSRATAAGAVAVLPLMALTPAGPLHAAESTAAPAAAATPGKSAPGDAALAA